MEGFVINPSFGEAQRPHPLDANFTVARVLQDVHRFANEIPERHGVRIGEVQPMPQEFLPQAALGHGNFLRASGLSLAISAFNMVAKPTQPA